MVPTHKQHAGPGPRLRRAQWGSRDGRFTPSRVLVNSAPIPGRTNRGGQRQHWRVDEITVDEELVSSTCRSRRRRPTITAGPAGQQPVRRDAGGHLKTGERKWYFELSIEPRRGNSSTIAARRCGRLNVNGRRSRQWRCRASRCSLCIDRAPVSGAADRGVSGAAVGRCPVRKLSPTQPFPTSRRLRVCLPELVGRRDRFHSRAACARSRVIEAL